MAGLDDDPGACRDGEDSTHDFPQRSGLVEDEQACGDQLHKQREAAWGFESAAEGEDHDTDGGAERATRASGNAPVVLSGRSSRLETRRRSKA